MRGPLDVADLGVTLMHEHVFVLTPELTGNWPGDWREDEQVPAAVDKLRSLRRLGVDTIVDPTVVGIGRDIPRLRRVAEQVDLNIVVATGLYTYDTLPIPLQQRGPGTMLGGPEPMVEMFVRDLTDGIADTGVRAAFLKCAIDHPGLTPGVQRVLLAVAEAHHRTGAPITVHTSGHNAAGLTAQDLLRSQGVDLGRVVIGHAGDSADLDYLRRLADAGSYLGMDRFGIELLASTAQRVATVAELCRAGYAERMVLSQDANCYIDWYPQQLLREAMPNWHYEHIHRVVLPALREQGVTQAQINTMLVDNPRRYFTG